MKKQILETRSFASFIESKRTSHEADHTAFSFQKKLIDGEGKTIKVEEDIVVTVNDAQVQVVRTAPKVEQNGNMGKTFLQGTTQNIPLQLTLILSKIPSEAELYVYDEYVKPLYPQPEE